MEDDSFVRSSLDSQIKEAKTRAELFSKSLNDARAQEAIALKILEEERERWAHSFEEKSIMIEQLERELTSTVEALDVERSIDKISLPKYADLKILSNEEVDQTFHELMEDVNARLPTFRKTMEVLDTSRADFGSRTASSMQRTNHAPPTHYEQSYPYHDTSHNQSQSVAPSSRHHQQHGSVDSRHYGSDAARHGHNHEVSAQHHSSFSHSGPAHAQHPHYHPHDTPQYSHTNHPHQQQHHLSQNQYPAQQQQPPQVIPAATHINDSFPPNGSAPAANTTIIKEDTSVWRDLLSQYQEQLKAVKAEAAAAVEEKDKLSRQTVRLEQQVKQLTEEKELFATACENAEGKLKFRGAQVLEYERDKEDQTKRIAELSALNGDLQAQLTSLRQELLVVNTELRVHSSRVPQHSAPSYGTQGSFPTSGDVFAHDSLYQRKFALSQDENGAMKNQQVLAAETRVQELNKQLSEAHSSYGIQLDEAQKVASSLQMLLKDAERRSDEFRSRAHYGEQAATQYKAERDALLTMVSKFHLAPEVTSLPPAVSVPTIPTQSAPFIAPFQPSYAPPVPSMVAASSGTLPHNVVSHVNDVRASIPAPEAVASSAHAVVSQSHDAQLEHHQHHKHSHKHQHVQDPPKIHGIAVVPFLASSAESVSLLSAPHETNLDDSLEHASDEDTYSGSESEEEEESEDEEEEIVLHPESATGSVLDVADKLHADSIGRSRDSVAGALKSSEPSQFASQSERQRVSLQGMLAASVDTVTSHGKKKKAITLAAASTRSARSQSKDHSVTKTKSKSKVATTTAPSVKRTAEVPQPAAAVGQPGKSMVIRKPPSYTGATIEALRGTPSSSSQQQKSHAKVKSVSKVVKGAITPRSSGSKVVKKPIIGASSDEATTSRQISPIIATHSIDYKDFVPPSYSNRNSVDPHDAHETHPTNAREHDISWESEVSRADTSVLSHDVGDFAEADAHYALHGTGAEERGLRQSLDQGEGQGQSLDAVGLTMGLMGFNHAQQPPSQLVPPNHRYQEVLRDSFEDHKHDDAQHYNPDLVHEDPQALQDLRESHEPQAQGASQRSNSLNSASMASTHSGRSSHRGSASKSQPSRMKYSGITDIKISHKLKPGDVVPARSVAPSAGVTINTATCKAPVSAGSRTLRTPSPMTRLASASGTSKRTSSAPRSRPLSSSVAVVTPNTGTASSKGRLISTSGSVLKKTPKDKSLSGSGPRRQSLMY